MRAKETAFVTLVVGAIFFALSYYMLNAASGSFESAFGELFGWLTLIVLLIMLIWSLLLATRKGSWLIEVTDKDVTWQAPPGIGEKSFRLSLSEIERVVCVPSTDPESENNYYLETKRPERIDLKPSHSGMNIQKFIQSLVDLGVSYELKEKA